MNYSQHKISHPLVWNSYLLWRSLKRPSDGVVLRTWIFGVSWFLLISCFIQAWSVYFVSFLSMFSPPLCFTFLSKDEDFYLQHTLLVLSSVFVRRDSSVIKEEIKAFLANRRISQAVVAQVTGKSWRALYSGIMSSLCLLMQILGYCSHFLHCSADLSI